MTHTNLKDRFEVKSKSVPECKLAARSSSHESSPVRRPSETEDGTPDFVGRRSDEFRRNGVNGIVAEEERRDQLQITWAKNEEEG